MKEYIELIKYYKEEINKGYMEEGYRLLTNLLMELKANFQKNHKDFTYGYISFGYLDYSYFSIVNDYLKKKKLRFGLVLNHKNISFEIWLMGRNKEIQEEYWEILKNTKWNKDISKMPIFSVLEVEIINELEKYNMDELKKEIEKESFLQMNEIIKYLETL